MDKSAISLKVVSGIFYVGVMGLLRVGRDLKHPMGPTLVVSQNKLEGFFLFSFFKYRFISSTPRDSDA